MSKLTDAASAGDKDVVLETWLDCLEGSPPYDDMISVLEILSEAGEGESARDLLEMTIEEKELEGGEGFQKLIFHSAEMFRQSEPLRKALIEALRDEHLMYQPLERFLKLSGLSETGADIPDSWNEFSRLMMYRDGGHLYHSTFGIGRIVRVSRTHITADFLNSRSKDIELDVALENSCPLSSDSLAVLALNDRDGFFGLMEETPEVFLSKLMNEPYVREGGIEEKDLTPVVQGLGMAESDMWKLVRKAASKAGGFGDVGSRIVALDEDVAPVEQLRRVLARPRVTVSEKVRQVRALMDSFSVPFEKELATLLDDVSSLRSPETGAIFELCCAFWRRSSGREFETLASSFVEKTAARAERALAEIQSQSCRKTYIEFFLSGGTDRDEIVTMLSSLRRSLWEHAVNYLEGSDPDLLSRCISLYLSDSSSTDLFLWSLVYLAGSRRDMGEEPKESGIELFLDNLVFASADTQKKVIGLLMGSLKKDLTDYLASIDTRKLSRYLENFDTSAIAHNEGLFLAVGREMSRRKSSGMRRTGSRHFWETSTLFSSRRSITRREEEIQRLKQIDIPAAAEAIGEAASHGDLSENAEYAAAIEKRDLLLGKYNRWREELQKYRPYPSADINAEVVSPGTRVTLQDTGESEEVRVLEVVGPLDAEPEKGRINYLSPMGKSILGLSVGDVAVLPGSDEREWRVALLEVLKIVEQ